MSFYQLRGVTGITPRRNNLADVYQQAALLPAQKQAEYTRQAQDKQNELGEKNIELGERSLDLKEKDMDQTNAYYSRMAGISEDAAKAADRDRNRGLWMQGGMTALSGVNALNDAVGGDLVGKTASTVKDVFSPAVGAVKDVFSPGVKDALDFAKPGDMMALGGKVYDPVKSIADTGRTIGDVAGGAGGFAKDYLVDPVVEGARKVGKWAGDAVGSAANWIGGLFS